MKARRDGKGQVELFTGIDWSYWIPETELGTRRGLLRWIRQLCDKRWITREHIAELLDISHELVSKV